MNANDEAMCRVLLMLEKALKHCPENKVVVTRLEVELMGHGLNMPDNLQFLSQVDPMGNTDVIYTARLRNAPPEKPRTRKFDLKP